MEKDNNNLNSNISKLYETFSKKTNYIYIKIKDSFFDLIDFILHNEFNFLQNSLNCLPTLTFTVLLLFVNFISIYYYQTLGLKFNTMLIVICISRCLEIIIDPIISNYYDALLQKSENDDNAKSLIAQYCLFNTIICGICILIHFIPDTSMGSNELAIWYGFSYVIFTISYSFVTFPIYVIIWFQHHPYQGVTNQMSPQLLISFLIGLFENIGLLLGFFLGFGMNNFSNDNTSTNTHINIKKYYSSCYDNSGVGTSCLNNPATNSKDTYILFDAKNWNSPNNKCNTIFDNYYPDPSDLFTPSICSNLNYNDDITNQCIKNYCTCIGECTNLHSLVNIQYGMMSLGIIIFLIFVSSISYLLYLKFGLRCIFKFSYNNNNNWNIFGYLCSFKINFSQIKRNIILFWNGRRRLRIPSNANITTNNNTNHNSSSASTRRVGNTSTTSIKPCDVEEPIVCKCMNLLKNPIVRSFLIPQFLDDVAYFTFLSIMYFYIQCVIAPEFQNYQHNCNYGISIITYKSTMWSCQTMVVTGVVLTVLITTSTICLLFWYCLIPYLGTTRTWQVHSLLNIFSIITFIFSKNKTDSFIETAIGLSVLIGFTSSGRFLSDCIAVDIINYYEFVSERHYPHMFVMFKNLGIKVTTILALVLFIPILFEVGYKMPVNTIMIEQNMKVEYVCYTFIIVIPSLLSLASFIFKIQIRLCEIEQYKMLAIGLEVHNNKIRRRSSIDTVRDSSISSDIGGGNFFQVGISNKNINHNIQNINNLNQSNIIHQVSESVADPISAILYPATFNTVEDLQTLYVFDNFWTLQNISDYYACAIVGSTRIGVDLLVIRMRDFAGACFFLLCGICVSLAVTSPFIYEKRGISVLPLLFITCLGYVIILFYGSIKRLQAVLSLQSHKNHPSIESLERVLRNAEIREEMYSIKLPIRAVLLQYIYHNRQGFQPIPSLRIRSKTNVDTNIRDIKKLTIEEEKEKELLDWEINLKAVVKKALEKTKITSLMIAKLKEKENKKHKRELYTLWEKEYYSYIAIQETKDIPNEYFPIPIISSNSLENTLFTIRDDDYSTSSIDTDESNSIESIEANSNNNNNNNNNMDKQITKRIDNNSKNTRKDSTNMNTIHNSIKPDSSKNSDDSIYDYTISGDFDDDEDNVENNNNEEDDYFEDDVISDEDFDDDDDDEVISDENVDDDYEDEVISDENFDDNSNENQSLDNYTVGSIGTGNSDGEGHSNDNDNNNDNNNNDDNEDDEDDEINYDTPSEIDYNTPSSFTEE